MQPVRLNFFFLHFNAWPPPSFLSKFRNNETALHFAIRAHAAKVVELLMEKGASDKIVGAFGSPLEMAAGNEAILAILQPEQHQK